MSDRGRLLLAGLWIAAAVAVCLSRFQLSADIRQFLPEGEDLRLARVSRVLADSPQSRTMVLSVAGDGPDDAIERARRLQDRLEGDPEVQEVVGGLDPDRARALEAALFPFRHGLLELDLDASAIGGAVAALKVQLLLPQDAAARSRLVRDPLGAWPAFLRRLRAGEGRGLALRDGRLLGRDGEHAILLVRTRHSPFEYDFQRPFLERLAASGIPVERAGAHAYAVASESSIRGSVNRIALVSTLGVIALFLLAFGSPRGLLLALLPGGVGVLTGLAAVLLISGRIHGLTLAFGASLVGVCIDYPVHLLGHQRVAGGTPREALRAVGPALLLGAGTTVAGFLGLMITDFPGIREIALFAAFGVGGALLATVLIVPALAPALPSAPGPRLSRILDGGLALLRRRGAAGVALGLALGVIALGALRIRWEDSLSALASPDPGLQREEERVTALASRWDPGRLVVVFGVDLAAALDAADGVERALDAAVASADLGAWTGPTRILPGPETQRRRQAAIAAAAPAVRTELARQGLRAEAFAGFADPPAAPLTASDLRDAGLGDLLDAFVVDLPDGGVALLHFLADVRTPPTLPDGAVFFDQGAFLDGIYRSYRQRTGRLLAGGLLAVFGLLLLRYRSPRLAAAAALPAVLAAGVALSVLALLGIRPNLLHLAATLLVLSIGVDYGVFLVEQRGDPEGLRAALPGIVVAAATTTLSFGALALSDQPALRSIGSVAGIGVLVAVLLAPAALALLAPRT